MLFVEGPAGGGMAEAIASRLSTGCIKCSSKVFPDGESEVGLGSAVAGQEVMIVQSTYPLQDKRLIELFLLAEDAKSTGASKVGAVVPYLAYARQDRRFEGKANAVSISAILQMMNCSGITTLVTAAPHKNAPLSAFKGTVKVADAITPLAMSLLNDVRAPFVIAPDKGASGISETFARVLGCDSACLEKERDALTGKVRIVDAPKLDLSGRDVVVVDDMISTGGTVVETAKLAKEKGAKRVIAAAVHLLMVGDAHQRLKDAGVSEIYGTNTIQYSKAHIVDISGQFASAIGNMSRNAKQKSAPHA